MGQAVFNIQSVNAYNGFLGIDDQERVSNHGQIPPLAQVTRHFQDGGATTQENVSPSLINLAAAWPIRFFSYLAQSPVEPPMLQAGLAYSLNPS